VSINEATVSSAHIDRVKLLSWITLAWLAIDGILGMTAGLTSNSVVLIGWGIDCAIEAVAAYIIIWRFTGNRIDSAAAEQRAQQVVAISFLLLVPYIVVMAVDHLITGNAAGTSWLGIGLAATDAVLMPFIGIAKKKSGKELNSHATTRSGVQNILCAYLSVAVLIGLGANALLGFWWADPIAALLVAVVCFNAGISTWRGDSCEDEVVCS
jgi:divalent metal cation (Fe/Co/Zn/Cd) transporter